MGWLARLCAAFIAVSVSGCAIIDAEKNNRGGFLDEIADEHWMKADSKKMRALRAVAIEASLARIAMIAPKSAPDRALLARRIGETSRRADLVRKCAFATQPIIAGQNPNEPCFFFDSLIMDYENALFDLALIALPIEEARKLITRVAGGVAAISINPLELIQSLLDIGREAFRLGRVVGAIYRDTLELEVQVWLASPQFAGGELARGVDPQFVVTEDRVAGLRAAYIRGNDNIPAWRAEIAALRAQGLEPVPHERFILEIYTILKYVCGQIVPANLSDDSYRYCVFPPALLRTGSLATIPRGLFGGVGSATGVGPGSAGQQELRGQLQQQEQQLQQQRQQLLQQGEQLQRQIQEQQRLQQELERLKQASRGPVVPPGGQEQPGTERWAAFRATLCIEGETGLTQRSLRALQLFRAQINNSPATGFDANLSDTEIDRLRTASQRFPTCRSTAADPPRNPFEVALFTFNRADQVTGLLRTALERAKAIRPGIYSPGPTDAFDLNRAVRELRGAYGLTPPEGMTEDQIDDAFWIRARRRT